MKAATNIMQFEAISRYWEAAARPQRFPGALVLELEEDDNHHNIHDWFAGPNPHRPYLAHVEEAKFRHDGKGTMLLDLHLFVYETREGSGSVGWLDGNLAVPFLSEDPAIEGWAKHWRSTFAHAFGLPAIHVAEAAKGKWFNFSAIYARSAIPHPAVASFFLQDIRGEEDK